MTDSVTTDQRYNEERCSGAWLYVCMYDVRHDIQIPCTRYVAINRLYLYLITRGSHKMPKGNPKLCNMYFTARVTVSFKGSIEFVKYAYCLLDNPVLWLTQLHIQLYVGIEKMYVPLPHGNKVQRHKWISSNMSICLEIHKVCRHYRNSGKDLQEHGNSKHSPNTTRYPEPKERRAG